MNENPFSTIETDSYFARSEQQIQKFLAKKDFYEAKMLSLDLMNKRLDDEENSGYYYDNDDEDAERLCKPSSAYPHACNVITFDLLDNKKLDLNLDVEFCTDIDGCERKNLNGTKMDIDELLKLNPMPIPCKICTANRMYRCCIIIGNK